MSNDEPQPDKCNAHPTQDGGYCGNKAGQGTDHVGEGRCKYHGGASTGPLDREAQSEALQGNTNGFIHGAYTDPASLLDALDESDRRWIGQLASAYVEPDGPAPFGPDDPRAERLLHACVMCWQSWTAAKRAIDVADPEDDANLRVSKDGTPILETRDDRLVRRERELSREVRQVLKDLGCLPGTKHDHRHAHRAELVVKGDDDDPEQRGTLADLLSSGGSDD